MSRKPVLLERMFFSERFPGLDEVFLECSSQAVAEQFGLEPVGGRQTFTVVDAGRYAKALGVDEKHSTTPCASTSGFSTFSIRCFCGTLLFDRRIRLHPTTDEFLKETDLMRNRGYYSTSGGLHPRDSCRNV